MPKLDFQELDFQPEINFQEEAQPKEDLLSQFLLKKAPQSYIGYKSVMGAVEPLVKGIISPQTIKSIMPSSTPSPILPYPIQQSIPPDLRREMTAEEISGLTSPMFLASLTIPLKRGATGALKKSALATEEFLLKNLSAISKPSQEVFKQYGYPEMKNIANKGISNYLIEDVIPKMQENILDNLTYNKLEPRVLEEFGFKPEDIKSLNSIAPNKLDSFKQLVKGNTLTNTLNTIATENAKIGKAIGNVENIASQTGLEMYFPRTNKILKGELRRTGVIGKDGSLNISPKDIDDPTLKSLIKVWERFKYKPLSLAKAKPEMSMTVKDYRLFRDSLESSIGGKPKYERIAYNVLEFLRDEASRQLNRQASLRGIDIRELNKAYSDNIRLSNIATKVDKAINDIPNKEAITAKGKYMNIFAEPVRRKLEIMFGKDAIENIRKMVAIDEVWPQDLGQLGSGVWRTIFRETPKQLLRFHKGSNKIIIPKK